MLALGGSGQENAERLAVDDINRVAGKTPFCLRNLSAIVQIWLA